MTPDRFTAAEWGAVGAILLVHIAVLALAGLLRWGARGCMPQPCARPRDASVKALQLVDHA